MYTLLSGLYKYMFRRDEYCILILGLDNAGKTTFLEQTKTRFNRTYKGMSLSKITTTVGLNIGTIDVGKARLMFWDLGGQDELQSLWDKYYAESHGVIYVIDSTDEERLSDSKRAFEKVVTSEALEGVPILVLANKQDVETCLSIPDIKTAFSDCINKIGRRDCLTQACSALTGNGVNEGIEWMVKCVVRNIHRPPRQKDITSLTQQTPRDPPMPTDSNQAEMDPSQDTGLERPTDFGAGLCFADAHLVKSQDQEI
ncbi:ADP-ribosylation factor-related protein 1 [Chelonia mydas]|uniref:ADP-ribosylation factor-related protein 1 n=4 Tax=Cheloniidae TaxID=8465 RepID=M7B5S5_CHEMY|nr:ADP-ribosylation factor-related protein 1 [Chelonia mydas]